MIRCVHGSSANGRADRPARDLVRGRLRHQLDVAPHALAVERRQQQLALAHVRVLVERQQRVLAERVAEHGRVRLAGVEAARVAGEELLDELRLGDVDELSEEREAAAEDVAVALAASAQEGVDVVRDQAGLHERRQARTGRVGRDGHGPPRIGRSPVARSTSAMVFCRTSVIHMEFR